MSQRRARNFFVQKYSTVQTALKLEVKLTTKKVQTDKTLTCNRTAAFDGLLHLLLVLPAQIAEARDVCGRLHGRAEPKAGEMMPVWNFTIEHGRLCRNKRECS